MYWTRRRLNFGFGLTTFSKSYFGSAKSHWARFGFGNYEFGRQRFGEASNYHGKTASFAKIDCYQGHIGRLYKRCISATGRLASEETYWRNHFTRRTACFPKSQKLIGKYLSFKGAKRRGTVSYIYQRWKKLTDEEKAVYHEKAKGKPVHGQNLFLKEFFEAWGFGRGAFGVVKFGAPHYPVIYFGFSTVAYGMGAFGTAYPEPRRLGFGVQSFGELRFGGNRRDDWKLREFRR